MRTFDESCVLIDRIIGRCIRDAAFAEWVLKEPEAALAEYRLEEHELDDFRALKTRHAKEAAEGWANVRAAMAAVRPRRVD
jgi:hypothetical protein